MYNNKPGGPGGVQTTAEGEEEEVDINNMKKTAIERSLNTKTGK